MPPFALSWPGSPYTPPAVVLVLAVDGGLPVMLPVAAAGDVVAARIDGGAGLHADIDEMLASPMQAPTRAVRTAVANRELDIFPRIDQSGNRLVSKVAPSANALAHFWLLLGRLVDSRTGC